MRNSRNTTLVRKILSISIGMGLASTAFAAETANVDAPQSNDTAQSSADARKTAATQASKSADSAELGTVTVTGYARSLEQALNVKREADMVTDGISAEDVGKYPEQNIAESLSRVTGVQLSRRFGDGQFISVRGLAPEFTNTLYNGRQLPSGSGSRAFDYQVLSANFANQVDVYKSPTPDLLESGLAATVNVQSLKPLDVGAMRAAVSAEGVYDSQAKHGATPHVTAFYLNTFMDNRFGFSAAVDYNKTNFYSKQFDASFSQDVFSPDQKNLRLFHIGHAAQVGTNERLSGTSTLQFKATDNLEFKLDTIASVFKQNYDFVQGFSSYPNANALGEAPTNTQTIGPENAEVAWSGSNVYSWVQANRFIYNQYMRSTALSGALTLGDWKIENELSYGKATQVTTNIYTQFRTPKGMGQNVWYDTTQNRGGPVPYGYYGGYNPNDPNNYEWLNLFATQWKSPTTDEIWNNRFDISRPLNFGWLKNLKFGVNFVDRTLGSKYNQLVDENFPGSSVMRQYLTLFPNFFAQGQPSQFITTNLPKFFRDYPLEKIRAEGTYTPLTASTTSVEEKATSVYARVDFGDDDERLKGNAGVRVVRTEEVSTGYGPTADAVIVYTGATPLYSQSAPSTYSNTYTNVLPTLNLSYEITDNLISRFALAKVLQRPEMSYLTQNSSVSFPSGPPLNGELWNANLNKGNPELKPYLSNQFDISLEWYFNKRGILAANFWQKSVQNWVVTTQHYEDSTAYIDLKANVTDPSLLGKTLPVRLLVSQPTNATKVQLKGLELSYQQAFDFLPGFWSGFGTQANFTYIKFGNVITATNSPPEPLPNISKNTYNVGLYYDNGTFDVHANYNYRSRFITTAPIIGRNLGNWVEGYGQLDLSASYKVSSNVSIYGSISNVLKEPLRNTDSIGTTTYYELNGRRVYLGARINF